MRDEWAPGKARAVLGRRDSIEIAQPPILVRDADGTHDVKRPWKESGERLGAYRIVRRVSSGGMGALYLATREGAGGFKKKVAIKVIHPHLAEDRAFFEMFHIEAKLVTCIAHPNVVKVDELCSVGGTHFFVMEYVDGCTLAEALYALAKLGRAFRPEIAVFLTMQIADGLHAAHTAKDEEGLPLEIVHRDVSPHNVLLSNDGRVKVIDFGIAKVSGHKTATGSLKGKIRYMSPEHAGGKTVDRRSDLYSLGIMLWEMLTHRRRFHADNDFAMLSKVREAESIPPKRFAKDISDALNAVVVRALDPDPDARYASMREFRRALREACPDARDVEHEEIAALLSHVGSTSEGGKEPTISQVAQTLEPGSGEAVVKTLTLEREDVAALEAAFRDDRGGARREPPPESAAAFGGAPSTTSSAPPRGPLLVPLLASVPAVSAASSAPPVSAPQSAPPVSEPKLAVATSARPKMLLVALGALFTLGLLGALLFVMFSGPDEEVIAVAPVGSQASPVTPEPEATAPEVLPPEPTSPEVLPPEPASPEPTSPEPTSPDLPAEVADAALERAKACDALACVIEALGEEPEGADEAAYLIARRNDAGERTTQAMRRFVRNHPRHEMANTYRRALRPTKRTRPGMTIMRRTKMDRGIINRWR